MLDVLFTFPIVMIDGDNEERKMKNKPDLGIPTEDDEEEYDMVFGKAEYPYFDFIGVEDRWLPSSDSLARAMTGDFDACIVRFLHAGQLLVPWTRKKFKAEFAKFVNEYENSNPRQEKKSAELRIVSLTPEQFKKATDE